MKIIILILLLGFSTQLMAQHHGGHGSHSKASVNKQQREPTKEYQLLIDASQLAIEPLINRIQAQSRKENSRDWRAFLIKELEFEEPKLEVSRFNFIEKMGLLELYVRVPEQSKVRGKLRKLEYIDRIDYLPEISPTYETDVKSEKGPAPEIDRSISPEKLARWTKGSGYTVIRQKLDAGAQTVMVAVVFNVKHIPDKPIPHQPYFPLEKDLTSKIATPGYYYGVGYNVEGEAWMILDITLRQLEHAFADPLTQKIIPW